MNPNILEPATEKKDSIGEAFQNLINKSLESTEPCITNDSIYSMTFRPREITIQAVFTEKSKQIISPAILSLLKFSMDSNYFEATYIYNDITYKLIITD
jgi:hypothetical protein